MISVVSFIVAENKKFPQYFRKNNRNSSGKSLILGF